MARLLTNLLALLIASAAFGQTFGRFGYHDVKALPGLLLDREGFRSSATGAEKFLYDKPITDWLPVSTSAMGQSANLKSLGQSPSRIKIDLYSYGFSMLFGSGFRFRLASATAPFLSWNGGSVGQEIPTASTNWILLSFHDKQPPMLLLFNKPTSCIVTGKAGAWSVKSVELDPVWVKIVPPTGSQLLATNTAAELGALVAKVASEEAFWLQPAPVLQKVDISEDADSVTAVWKFDRAGAVLPFPTYLAPMGGYSLAVQSQYRTIAATEEGPINVCEGTDIKVRFPVRRLLPGRPLAMTGSDASKLAVNPKDVATTVNIALANLEAGQHPKVAQMAEDSLAQYLTGVTYTPEPYTSGSFTFDADGKGVDLAAANALLFQSLGFPLIEEKSSNALLSALLWKRDWLSWSLPSTDNEASRRAAALTALACALQNKPQGRLDGAMFEAGLAAERGRETWRRRKGYVPNETPLLEPVEALRQAIYGALPLPAARWEMLSAVRSEGERPVKLSASKDGALISWFASGDKPLKLYLPDEAALSVRKGENVSDVARKNEEPGLASWTCSPVAPGLCRVLIPVTPAWEAAAALLGVPASYSETKR